MADPFIGPTNAATIALPSQWQTDRQDIQAAVLGMLTLFRTTYPSYIRAIWTERPLSVVNEGPMVYVGRIVEQTTEDDRAIRQTVFNGVIGYCDTLVDPRETSDRVNVFADFMRELFTFNARMLPQGVFYIDGLDDSPEVKQGVNVYQTDVQLSWRFVVLRGANINPSI